MSRRLYLGRSGSGKTTLMVKHILKEIKNLKPNERCLFILSPSAMMQKQYKPLKKYVTGHSKTLDDHVGARLYRYVLDPKNRNKKKFVVIDDLGEDTYLRYKKKGNKLNELIICCLHYDLHLYFCYQTYAQPIPTLRSCSDIIYVFKIDDKDSLRKIWKQFAGSLDQPEFLQLLTFTWRKKYDYLKIDRTDTGETKFFHNNKPLKVKKGFFD